MSNFLQAAFLAAAICTLPSNSNAATIDFDDFVPTDFGRVYSELVGVIAATEFTPEINWRLTRPGARFDVESSARGAPEFPSGPANALNATSNSSSRSPFVLSFDKPVRRVAFGFGIQNTDGFGKVRLNAFSAQAALGDAIAQRSALSNERIPSNGFNGGFISITANDNIRAVKFIGGTKDAPNGAYYSDIFITPVPLPASVSSALAGIALFGGLAAYRRRIKRA